MKLDIKKTKVFCYKDKDVYSYSLKNNFGFTVKILNLGGIITDIIASDINQNFENIVLKFKNIKDYIPNNPYFGAIIGRTSGRISNGEFQIMDQKYILSKNDCKNNLHGGIENFTKKIWEVKEIREQDSISLLLSYFSKDKEEGYPGNLKVTIKYTVTNSNELIIEYRGKTDKATLLNMTNHSYFNLSGNNKYSVLSQNLYIDGDYVMELGKTQTPTGKLLNVKNTPFDFRILKNIGNEISKNHPQLIQERGYNHPWIINGNETNCDAMLADEKSGRVLLVYTNQPTIVCYSFNFPCKESLEYDIIPKKHDAICFETQNIPDGINLKGFPSSILMPNDEYYKITKFKFTTLDLIKK